MAGGGAGERRIDPVLVEAMAGLVQRREECVAQVVAAVAGSDAHVVHRHGGLERVHGLVEAPRIILVAKGPGELQPQRLLALDREIPAPDRGPGRVLPLGDQADDRREPPLHAGKEGAQLGGGVLEIVQIEERVVGMRLRRETIDHPLLEIDHLLQRGRERREIAPRLGIDPDRVRGRRMARDRGSEVGGDAAAALDLLARQANVGAGRVGNLQTGHLRGGGIDLRRELRAGPALMRDLRQRGHCLAARRRASRRHGHQLVPAEQRHRRFEVGDLAEQGTEGLVCARHGGSSPASRYTDAEHTRRSGRRVVENAARPGGGFPSGRTQRRCGRRLRRTRSA